MSGLIEIHVWICTENKANFEMQKWMAPASCSSLFNIVSSYIWGARRLFATLDLLSRFKCQNVVQQLSLLGFNYNFEAICCCFFYLSCTPQNIIIFFRRSKIISVIWWSSSILESELRRLGIGHKWPWPNFVDSHDALESRQ